MKSKYTNTIIISFFLTLLFSFSVSAQMSGGEYEVYTDKFSVVSTDAVSGGAYDITQSGGQYFATTTSEGDFELRGGFQAQEKGILKVDVSKSNLSLGELTTNAIAKDSVQIEVSTDSETGYNLAIRENNDLTSGGDTIADVTDNSVTTGAEEYGIEVSGSDAIFSQDLGIDSSPLNIAATNGRVQKRNTKVTFKASLGSKPSQNRNYTHKVFFDITVNP